ncbi:MAG: putative rane-associated phospholipid phosphatase [Thermoleophilia bacterium]|nr:putative rane-associated phospholipid phosphatase [Thermoleophilia bacterium]
MTSFTSVRPIGPVLPATTIPVGSPQDVDETLVPGLRLPKIPGLPDASDPGMPLRRLPGPPAPGTAAYRADMAVVKGAQLLRTPQGDAWAVRMANDGATKIWFELAARHRAATGKVQGWLDTALLASTIASNGATTWLAKRHYDRQRPYQVDPSIKPPVHLPAGASFPSGHASSAFAAARVISVLAPELATEAYALATQVAVSRVYAGVHFPTDVVAGALLGTAVGEAALRVTGRRIGPLTDAEVGALLTELQGAAA